MGSSADSKYLERHLRQIGIMTEEQLLRIRNTPVAVAGLGLGGSVFINLVRLGFENFHVADPDVYERTNVARQRGARETTIGLRKDDCLIDEARAINPGIRIRAFRDGVNEGNLTEFLEGMELVVDAVDIFAIPEKLALHERARECGLPVVTCVSAGFGAAFVFFDRTTPTFSELSGAEKTAPYSLNLDRFVKFVAPEVPEYMKAQLDRARDRSSHIPFAVPGVEISAGMVATAICQRMLGLGEQVMAPYGVYFDPVNLRLERFRADYRERDGAAAAAGGKAA